MYTFAELLKSFRQREGLTQQQLADKLGVHRNSISDWERSKYVPETREMVLDLADALGLGPADTDRLLFAAQYPLEHNTSESELASFAQVEQARVGRMVVERIEWLSAPPRPSRPPLRTRIPDSRAVRFVGRTEELDWVCQRLKASDVAAIAGVRGIGGIGKTELAIAAAKELETHFEGRVIWLDCGARDVRAVQDEMAFALGVELKGDDLLVRRDALTLAFEHQPPILVVLDDVRKRHLSDFAALKPPCPPCALLVTSRRPDLPLPGPAIHRLDVLSQAQSRELLSDLLGAEPLAAEPDVAEAIAQLLERIPLALTLAARRAAQIAGRGDDRPLGTLLAELRARRLQVLDQSGGEARPDLSVVVTFQLSYEDLDPADQARLRRLGVFARNQFTLPAIQAVWGDDERAARGALQRLGNAGLIEEMGQDVWWMHDLLREYALERLTDAGQEEEQAARLGHAAYWQYYLDNAQRLSIQDWQMLEAQRPEVEQASHWLLKHWQLAPALMVELAFAISQKFQSYAFPESDILLLTGLEVARGLFQAAAEKDEQRTWQSAMAAMQSSLAALLRTRGQYDEAERLYRASLAVKEKLGDSRSVAVTQSSLADLLRTRGQYDEAERLY